MGLSAYAAYQRRKGHRVSGSDRTDSAIIADLRRQGVEVSLAQDGSALPAETDLFVYSEAIPQASPERRLAMERGIRQQSYFQALGDLTREHRLLAVCGTHGKSSTVAMAAKVLVEAGTDPSVIVGTKVRELEGRNWRRGESDLFLVEACEYQRSFHALSPDVVLMTNADGDHFDYFSSSEDYEQAFVDFLRKLPADGVLLTHMRDPLCASIAQRWGGRTVDADTLPLPTLATPGVHMQRNAQLVLGLAGELGLSSPAALTSLSSYRGCWRRMEVRGTWGEDVTVIDDYAHHPSEIRATIQAMRETYPRRRLVVVFQPHTHDRTLKLYRGFTEAFRGVDSVIIPNIYDARSDREQRSVDIAAFVRDIASGSAATAIHGQSLQETERRLRGEILRPHDVLLCMGAGDVTALAGRMVTKGSGVGGRA